MKTSQAIVRAAINKDKPLMVFDWVKAAKIIKEKKPKVATAGLLDDEEWTAGIIYKDGKIVTDEYTHLSSTWATPVLIIKDKKIPCYTFDTKWDHDTKWPEEAVREL
jgi:hypothetical protein